MRSPIFIVGPHRAGSTLWHNLIAMVPGVMRLAEPRFLGPARQRDFKSFLETQAGSLSSEEGIRNLVELCFSKKGFPGLEGAFWRFENIDAVADPRLKQNVARRILDSDRSLGAIARIFIEELTALSGCDRACVKFPVDIEHMAVLLEWFPDCRIVHITRDPRALAVSKSNDPSGTAIKILEHPHLAWLIRKGTLWLTVRQYLTAARVHRRLQHLPAYRLFRYEDLLVDPEHILRELCDFIEVDFRQEMLDPAKGRHEHQPSSLTGKRQKAFDPDAAIRWRRTISPFDRHFISLLTRSSMKSLGYDSTNHPIYARGSGKNVRQTQHQVA